MLNQAAQDARLGLGSKQCQQCSTDPPRWDTESFRHGPPAEDGPAIRGRLASQTNGRANDCFGVPPFPAGLHHGTTQCIQQRTQPDGILSRQSGGCDSTLDLVRVVDEQHSVAWAGVGCDPPGPVPAALEPLGEELAGQRPIDCAPHHAPGAAGPADRGAVEDLPRHAHPHPAATVEVVTPQTRSGRGRSKPAIDVTVRTDNRVLRTVEEAAERLGIGRSNMYRLLATGQVRSIRIGRLRRIPVEALDHYVASRYEEPFQPPPVA